MRGEKGITLVALVITIIVLLILAGVSISLVVGDKGILSQASNAASTFNKKSIIEEVSLAWASADSEYWELWSSDTTLTKTKYYANNASDGLDNKSGADRLNAFLQGKGTISNLTYNQNGTATFNYTPNGGSAIAMTVDAQGVVDFVNDTTNDTTNS